jgi:hypothetical protein
MSSNQGSGRIPAGVRYIAMALAMVVGMHGLVPWSYGNPIQSEPVSMEDARAANLATIQQALELKVVQHRLESLGFTQDEIAQRLSVASDADLHQLATQSEDVLAGGAVGLLVSVLVVILLVILILRIVSNETGRPLDMLVA